MNRQDALLKRAFSEGDVVRIRRGLYVSASPLQNHRPDPFVLSQHVYGPSYISFESALAYHGWIPEAVYTIAAASLHRSRVFDTPAGRFEFIRVPQHFFFQGVVRVDQPERKEPFLMASPLKALVDIVYVRRFEGSLTELTESLRIDEEQLAEISTAELAEISGNYRSKPVARLVKQIGEEIK